MISVNFIVFSLNTSQISMVNRPIIYLLWTSIVYKHWPETCDFIKQTIELWARWIRLSCYYSRV